MTSSGQRISGRAVGRLVSIPDSGEQVRGQGIDEVLACQAQAAHFIYFIQPSHLSHPADTRLTHLCQDRI
jgi:hypothetical protein